MGHGAVCIITDVPLYAAHSVADWTKQVVHCQCTLVRCEGSAQCRSMRGQLPYSFGVELLVCGVSCWLTERAPFAPHLTFAAGPHAVPAALLVLGFVAFAFQRPSCLNSGVGLLILALLMGGCSWSLITSS